jgi:hypothetical protein
MVASKKTRKEGWEEIDGNGWDRMLEEGNERDCWDFGEEGYVRVIEVG